MVGPRYVLEVSSPGIERPLRWPAHWRRFVGQHARVRADALGGRREVEIVAVPDDEHVTLRPVDGVEVTLPLEGIRDARLMADLPELRPRPPEGRRK
jgi:ribosome maturation factor RimP